MGYEQIKEAVGDQDAMRLTLIAQYYDRSTIPTYMKLKNILSQPVTRETLGTIANMPELPAQVRKTAKTYLDLSDKSFKLKQDEISAWANRLLGTYQQQAADHAQKLAEFLGIVPAPDENPVDLANVINNTVFETFLFDPSPDKNLKNRVWAAVHKWAGDLSDGDKEQIATDVMVYLRDVMLRASPKLGPEKLQAFLASNIKGRVWTLAKKIRETVHLEDVATSLDEDTSFQEAIDLALFLDLAPEEYAKLVQDPEVEAQYREMIQEWGTFIRELAKEAVQLESFRTRLPESTINRILRLKMEGRSIREISRETGVPEQKVSTVIKDVKEFIGKKIQERAPTPEIQKQVQTYTQRYKILERPAEVVQGVFKGLTGTVQQQVAGNVTIALDSPLTLSDVAQRVRDRMLSELTVDDPHKVLDKISEFFTEGQIINELVKRGIRVDKLSDLDVLDPQTEAVLKAVVHDLVESDAIRSASALFEQLKTQHYLDPEGKSTRFVISDHIRALTLPESDVVIRGAVPVERTILELTPKERDVLQIPELTPEEKKLLEKPPKKEKPEITPPQWLRWEMRRAFKSFKPGQKVKVKVGDEEREGTILQILWPWQSRLKGLPFDHSYLVHVDGQDIVVTEDNLDD